MKYLFIFMFIILLSTTLYANTDYNCMSDCSEAGYMYSFCKDKCSYNPKNYYDSFKYDSNTKKDYGCMSDCSKKGYMYQYCSELCSYNN